MIERREPLDGLMRKACGKAIDGIAMVPEIAHEPVSVAGENQVVRSVVLEVSKRNDGEIIEAACSPKVFFRGVLATKEPDGGEVHGKDDTRGDRPRSIVNKGESHERIRHGDGLV